MSFNDIIGQSHAKDILKGQYKSGRIPHAFLFLGQVGVGRNKTALELAKLLNCQSPSAQNAEPCDRCISCSKITRMIHPDVQIINFDWQANLLGKDADTQKSIKIDTIRALQKEISLKPSEGRWKIFIIETAEKITPDAANCLLKTLEEPPSYTVLILLARHKENLPATVVSRTQIIAFSPLADNEIRDYLISHFSLDPNHAAEVAKLSEGSLSWAVAHINEKTDDIDEIWNKLTSGRVPAADILVYSQLYSKNAPALINGLLLRAKADFRKNPENNETIFEMLIKAQNYLDHNVNPQMILDNLLLRISRSSTAVNNKIGVKRT